MLPDFSKAPLAIQQLPRDPASGWPIPFFVAVVDGVPNLRVADVRKHRSCVAGGLCWICGTRIESLRRDALGEVAFVGGPLSTVTATFAEGWCHEECAEYACRVCPYLTGVRKDRIESGGTRPPNSVERRVEVIVLAMVNVAQPEAVVVQPYGNGAVTYTVKIDRARYFRGGVEVAEHEVDAALRDAREFVQRRKKQERERRRREGMARAKAKRNGSKQR